jgi:ribonucleoside-diphosphate reductase alpha chain
VSSGLEPVYALQYDRGVREADGSIVHVPVECYALAQYVRTKGEDAALTDAFVTIADVGPDAQLRMQAALQAHVDNAIAKTVNVPSDIGFAEFAATYRRAYALGLKGCTVYRPNAVTAPCCRRRRHPSAVASFRRLIAAPRVKSRQPDRRAWSPTRPRSRRRWPTII